MCAIVAELNLSLDFQIITEDVQTFLEEFRLYCILYEILPG